MIRIVGAALVLLLTSSTVSSTRAVEHALSYSVQVDAVVEVSPPRITLKWPQDSTGIPNSYIVCRKTPGASEWGEATTLTGTTTTYADTSVEIGRAYEYRVVKTAASYTGYGYVQTGINIPLVDDRGTVVLIVDQTYATHLALELGRLQMDLVGDGWTVRRHDVGRADPVASVKALIRSEYAADPKRVKSVFLFGHVPVPYSGKLNPDKHADHVGAWPADVYYGDMHGEWTDRTVNYRQSLNADPVDAARLTNIPGDGKFDQTTIPAVVELEVGRVDLANLPGRSGENGVATFPSEVELLRQYLNKDHAFRHGLIDVQRRAVVGDYFGVRGGEAFSASGYRSFAPLVGANNIANVNLAANATGRWIPTLSANAYLLAYGCGPGSYQTIDGLGNNGPANDGNSVDMVKDNIQAVFTLIFGSWLGDWDHEDDIMRSILAAPSCSLAAAWSGRPHWFVHPLGLGETIGYATRLTQNNTGLYQNEINRSANLVHIALMGDPTLRLHPVAPGGAIRGTTTPAGIGFTWGRAPERVVGYHVYRATAARPAFVRLTSEPIRNNAFVDTDPQPGAAYMVRSVKLESTPSGTYYNASQGVFWSANEISAPKDGRPASATLAANTTRALTSQISPNGVPESGASRRDQALVAP